jgi:hypothetical protein
MIHLNFGRISFPHYTSNKVTKQILVLNLATNVSISKFVSTAWALKSIDHKKNWGWKCSSVIEPLPTMHKALSSIHKATNVCVCVCVFIIVQMSSPYWTAIPPLAIFFCLVWIRRKCFWPSRVGEIFNLQLKELRVSLQYIKVSFWTIFDQLLQKILPLNNKPFRSNKGDPAIFSLWYIRWNKNTVKPILKI